MSYRPDALGVAYDEELLEWQLGEGHPTNPVRAQIAVEMLEQLCTQGELDVVVEPITGYDWRHIRNQLERVHTKEYISKTIDQGLNSEWKGMDLILSRTAGHMFAGTVQLAHAIDRHELLTAFAPQGAKHHAMANSGSGFCVFNDMAWAAVRWADAGHEVVYIDLDAHHGDGVEALTLHNPRIRTFSVHDSTIFPGTGLSSSHELHAYNFPLPAGAGDSHLRASVASICGMVRSQLSGSSRPVKVLVAIGGDGHKADPLSSLQYSYSGYAHAGKMIGQLAAELNAPVLMGGAGGYRPMVETPTSWVTFVSSLEKTYRRCAQP